jgi:hypothetical protein
MQMTIFIVKLNLRPTVGEISVVVDSSLAIMRISCLIKSYTLQLEIIKVSTKVIGVL